MFLTIWLQAVECYVEWAHGVMELNAAAEECHSALTQDGWTQQGFWDCVGAYAVQWATLAADFFGCFQ